MTTKFLDVVESRLPVFDDTALICGYKPVVAMRPSDGAYSGIVGL